MISAGTIGGGQEVPVAPPAAAVSVGDVIVPANNAPDAAYEGFKFTDLLTQQQTMFDKQAAQQNTMFDKQADFQGNMFLWQSIGQGVGDIIKTAGWIWGMSIQADAMRVINDRRMQAQESVAGYQAELGMKVAELQGQANERMYGPNGYARELANIEARTKLATVDKTLEHKERMAAMSSLDRAFSIDNRSDYSYGNPFAA